MLPQPLSRLIVNIDKATFQVPDSLEFLALKDTIERRAVSRVQRCGFDLHQGKVADFDPWHIPKIKDNKTVKSYLKFKTL